MVAPPVVTRAAAARPLAGAQVPLAAETSARFRRHRANRELAVSVVKQVATVAPASQATAARKIHLATQRPKAAETAVTAA